MAATTTKKTRASAGPIAVRSKSANGATSRDARHRHKEEKVDYKKGTVRLSAGLAETVAGTLISAMCRNPKHEQEVKESRAYTREYEDFAEMKHPEEVRRWVMQMFRSGGPGLAAIESELEIYIDELSAWMDNALRYHEGHWCLPNCNCIQNPTSCQ